MFQSTRPRGARPEPTHTEGHSRVCFNPRARAGRDVVTIDANAKTCGFQSTRPRGARRHVCLNSRGMYVFQSTRPRGARPVRSPASTPARLIVSIHAPARGATVVRLAGPVRRRCFNPRARAGRDGDFLGVRVMSEYVSIHAPARGATGRTVPIPSTHSRFNPRARAGRDALNSGDGTYRPCFNPRARAGRDVAR